MEISQTAPPPTIPLVSPVSSIAPNFNVIIPKPFKLSEQDPNDLKKIRDEIMDKEKTWERSMNSFFNEYEEYSGNWRVKARERSSKPRGVFNCKSGETHRATETIATSWFRMLTASDQFFMAIAKGLDPLGGELSEEQLFMVEGLLMEQLRKTHFKHELLKSLRSCALFGTMIFEEPWIRRMNLDGQSYFEGTGFQLSSLIRTGFDTTCWDIDSSDYIFTVDYPTIWRLRSLADSDPGTWDKSLIYANSKTEEMEYSKSQNMPKTDTGVLKRIIERRQRAGYTFADYNIRELFNYHGRLNVENTVIQRYWESEGLQNEDPANYDFTVSILDGDPVIRFHLTQYGTWRSRFKTAHFKSFELEPMGYGVGRIAQRLQKDIDITFSRMQDVLLFSFYSQWVVGRFAGLKPEQLTIKPWNIIEMDDVEQLKPLRPDLNAIAMGSNLQGMLREELRSTTGATANLQAVLTKATATESAITQSEAIRGVSVIAELIAETTIREHLEQMHINNLDNLDEEIWIAVTGGRKPRSISRRNLPKNVGFQIKVTTDKDFRPERIQKILEALQMTTSIRNIIPQGVSAVLPLFEEFFRDLGMNPRLLHKPTSVAEELMNQMKMARMKGNPALALEDQSVLGGEAAGSGAQVTMPTPSPTMQP